jgi:hypothetical protein
LLENCSENMSFEFRIADFADCIWDANLEWRMNCKIKIDLSQFTVFRVVAWAIDEDLEFSTESRIEFARVDSKLDTFEFFFETEKVESDALTEDSYERDVKSNFENKSTLAEFSKSEEIEIKELESRAFTIWFAIFVEIRVRNENETKRINLEIANDCELIEFLKDSLEWFFEKLDDKSTIFSKLTIALFTPRNGSVRSGFCHLGTKPMSVWFFVGSVPVRFDLVWVFTGLEPAKRVHTKTLRCIVNIYIYMHALYAACARDEKKFFLRKL